MFGKRRQWTSDYADYYDERPQRTGRTSPAPAPPRRPAFWIHGILLLLIAGGGLFAVRASAGQEMFEGALKALLSPVGIVWMLLFAAIWFSIARRQGAPAFVAFLGWLVLTAGGNSFTVWYLANSLQQPYLEFDGDKAEPCKVLLVLGGGTSTTPAGKGQGGGAADRAIVAARMALSGKAERIVCSGVSGPDAGDGSLTAAGEMAQILEGLGVPAERITQIGGRNTREELAEFAKWLRDHPDSQGAAGIVTSAWHMNRAMRLAREHEVDARPVPADFFVSNPRATPHLVIPGAANLLRCQTCLYEYAAQWFGR
jgi:uncharacterized SAM-binding protein YcdF (DUF218 family)